MPAAPKGPPLGARHRGDAERGHVRIACHWPESARSSRAIRPPSDICSHCVRLKCLMYGRSTEPLRLRQRDGRVVEAGAFGPLPSRLVGEPQPISLVKRLHAMRPVWRDLAENNNLAEADIDRLAPGAFGNFIFNVEADAIFDMTKARRAGLAMDERSDDVRQRKLIL
jgi:hypothetical protein